MENKEITIPEEVKADWPKVSKELYPIPEPDYTGNGAGNGIDRVMCAIQQIAYEDGRKDQYLSDQKEMREMAEKAIDETVKKFIVHSIKEGGRPIWASKTWADIKVDIHNTLFPTSKTDIPNQ